MFGKISGQISYIESFLEQPLDKRITCSKKFLTMYPERVPIIVGTYDLQLGTIRKNRYLVPRDLKVGLFVMEIRKNLENLKAEQSIFLFVKNTLPPSVAQMGSIYDKYKNEDGFLYISYSGENTFGN